MTIHPSRPTLKTLLAINAVILLVLLMAVILPDYCINYPVYVSFIEPLTHFEWLIFLGILIAGVLLSCCLACIRFKNLSYPHRFQIINIFFDVVFLLFISYHGILAIHDAQREYELLSSEYKTKAKSDIKNGLIVYEIAAGLPIRLDSVRQGKAYKIDSLKRTYGIETRNIGCMNTAPLLRAHSDYEKLTATYLEKRNGPGWKHRMNSQIEKIRER